MSSTNRDHFTSSFPTGITLFFSSLTALARISSATLNSSSECRYPYLVPDLMQEAFYFIIKYVLSCQIFIDSL